MKVILFDGVCNLCNSSVNWVIDHDHRNQFQFAALQSAYGKTVVEKFSLHDDFMDTVLLVEDNKVWQRSDAALQILKTLGGIYSLAVLFYVVPSFIRNMVYNFVARNRYKWFGKQDECRVPTADLKTKFLD